MSTLVYRYGLCAPTVNRQLVEEQMRLAHRYRNTLIEIERGRRAAQRAALSACPLLRDAEAAAQGAEERVTAQLDAIRAMRSAARGYVGAEGPAERAELANRKQVAAVARALFFVHRRAAHWAMEEERARIDELAAGLRRNARAHCGVYWGTYQLAEAADDAARKAPLYDGTEPNDPRFVLWDGDGQVSVQFVQGLAADAVHDGTQVRIGRVDAGLAWESPIRGERRRFSRTYLDLRIGSDEGRGPVWGSWPMIQHRPLPDGATLKRVTVSRRMRGPREEWSCEITVDCERAPRVGLTADAVAIDIGWRLMPDGGVRVATWLGTDGERGALRAAPAIVSALEKVESLTGIRARAFNAARDALVEWREGQLAGLEGETAPTRSRWLAAAASLRQWRSPERMTALIHCWARERFAGDESAFAAAEAWRYHDRHLWRWIEDQRLKTLRRRREQYRVFAAGLTRRYRTLVLEVFDLRTMARAAPMEAPGENPHARWQRHAMSTSELRLVLCNAFRRPVGTLKAPWPDDVDARDTTRRCAQCGVVASFHAADSPERDAPCECGARWDQDENAAENLARAGTGAPAVAARTASAAPRAMPPACNVGRVARNSRSRVAACCAGPAGERTGVDQ